MELLIGVVVLVLLVLWGVAGWWRYWRAVQAAAVERRYQGAQIDGLWRALGQSRAAPPPVEQDARARRDAWAEAVLDEVTKGWTE